MRLRKIIITVIPSILILTASTIILWRGLDKLGGYKKIDPNTGKETIDTQKSALFVIISDTDSSFNFIVALMYSQLFCYQRKFTIARAELSKARQGFDER